MMFTTSHIHVPRNRRPSALRTFITSSSFGPPDTKEPLRRGILLTAVACVLLLIGSILTWLGFNDVFGGRMSMTGPLLIALSLLLLLLSFRQFLLARKRNGTNTRTSMQLDSVNGETMTAVVVNRDDGLRPSTVVVDRYNRIGYDTAVTVHRYSENDCAPPSYHEVTQFSSSSNTPSCNTHDGLDELPPTYEETMGSSIYHPPPLVSSSTIFPVNSVQDRSMVPASSQSMTEHHREVGQVEGVMVSHRVPERDTCHSAFSPKHSPLMKPAVPSLRLESRARVQHGVTAGNHVAMAVPMMPPPQSQNSLTLPAQHMSAPASPRQLSAPSSPHPFSAPPSPRHLSPYHTVNPPPQRLSPGSSTLQLSGPSSLHMPASPSPRHFSGPPSPYVSAPPSPHPIPGQHSLTPPPQYTSAPPSPRQLSAPPSPHIFSSPRSPCMSPNPQPVHPLSPQPPPRQFSASPLLHQLPGTPYQFPASSSVSQQDSRPWAPTPPAGSSREGYTCFTYNFVTPLPVEMTQAMPGFQGHTSSVSYPVRDCTANPSHPACPDSIGTEGRFSHPRMHSIEAVRESMFLGHRRECHASAQPERISQRGSNTSPSTFASRTDIQANI